MRQSVVGSVGIRRRASWSNMGTDNEKMVPDAPNGGNFVSTGRMRDGRTNNRVTHGLFCGIDIGAASKGKKVPISSHPQYFSAVRTIYGKLGLVLTPSPVY